MIAPQVWAIIRETLEKVLPAIVKQHHECNWDQEAARRMMPDGVTLADGVEMCPGCRTLRFRPDSSRSDR